MSFDEIAQKRLAATFSPDSEVSTRYGIYKCGADTRLFVDDVWLKEVSAVEFTEHSARIPLFGYDSIIFDSIAEGHQIVQGTIRMNIIRPGQLFSILKYLGYSPTPHAVPKEKSIENLGEGLNEENFLRAVQEYKNTRSSATAPGVVDVPQKFFTMTLVMGILNNELTMPSLIEFKSVVIMSNSIMVDEGQEYDAYQFIAREIVEVNDNSKR